PLSSLSWEVRGDGARPLLHLWSANHNLTRRVLAITNHSEHCLTLAVECFGRAKPARLEFVRTEMERSVRKQSREEFCQWTASLCSRQFPDETADGFSTHADLEHSLSGNFARGVLKSGRVNWAVLAAPETESSISAVSCLSFGLLWLEKLRCSPRRAPMGGLRPPLPKGTVPETAHLLPALNPKLKIEIYECDPASETLERIDPFALTNISTWLVARRETQSLLDRARPDIQRV